MPESTNLTFDAATADDTLELAGRLARALPRPLTQALAIELHGELGSGKTTFARGFLRALGINSPVRSPSYTLVENYFAQGLDIAHLDLFRVASAQELEELAIRDLLQPDEVLLIEWPERGQGLLPPCDVSVTLRVAGEGRRIDMAAHGARGEALLSRFR